MKSRVDWNSSRFWCRLGLAASVLAYLILGLQWIHTDRLPRDGDEEGHVGAAELVMQAARENPVDGLGLAVAGDLGHYPPLYPGVVGLYWAATGAGDPGRLAVRGLNLLWPLLAAWSIWAVLRRSGPVGASVGAALFLWAPGVVGMSRYFMPEGMLIAAVAGVLWGLCWLREERRAWAPVVVGLLVGATLLIKQTGALYLVGPLVFGLPRDRRGLWVLLVAAFVVAPWYVPHLGAQLDYGSSSVVGDPAVSMWRHLGFYPAALVLGLLGPAFALMLLPDRKGEPTPRSFERVLAWVALGSGLILLFFIPKKYPRLLLPLLPAVFLLVGQHWQGIKQRGIWVTLAAFAIGWTAGLSAGAFTLPRSVQVIDGRCPQQWIRGAVSDDWGLGRVIEAARSAPAGGVFVQDPPEIPCTLQTTFAWDHHLGPALRRAGEDRPVAADANTAALWVQWGSAQAAPAKDSVFVPTLGRWFQIHIAAP